MSKPYATRQSEDMSANNEQSIDVVVASYWSNLEICKIWKRKFVYDPLAQKSSSRKIRVLFDLKNIKFVNYTNNSLIDTITIVNGKSATAAKCEYIMTMYKLSLPEAYHTRSEVRLTRHAKIVSDMLTKNNQLFALLERNMKESDKVKRYILANNPLEKIIETDVADAARPAGASGALSYEADQTIWK